MFKAYPNFMKRIISLGFMATVLITGLLSITNLSAQVSDDSGIIHTAGTNGEEFNLVKVKFETALNGDQNHLVESELNKYSGLQSIQFESGQYMLVKFNSEISINQILAVLDKINHPGHYLVAGTPVYYIKDNSIYFIR